VLAYRHGIVAEIAASELDGGIDHAKEMMRNTWRCASRIKSDRKLKLGIGELAGRQWGARDLSARAEEPCW